MTITMNLRNNSLENLLLTQGSSSLRYDLTVNVKSATVLTFSNTTMADTSNKQVENAGGTLHKNSGALLGRIRDSKTGLILSYKHSKLK